MAEKKVQTVGLDLSIKRALVEPGVDAPRLRRQCELIGLNRASWYAKDRPARESAENLALMRRLDELYTAHPFYGSRKMTAVLRREGWAVNRKRVRRLMRLMGLQSLAPRPNTSRAHPAHPVYPYWLRDTVVERPNQVWATDITYIRIERGFAYLVAVMDWQSRKVLAGRLSNTLDVQFCLDALQEALRNCGPPEIFNTDPGCQFTSRDFTGVLQAHGRRISMDGKGRAFDNIFVERLWRSVKYEEVVCYERNRRSGRKRCLARDEGRPLEVGLQEQASNRLKLRRSRAFVVSVDGKGGARLRPVWLKETNASEPLMTCRNVSKRRRNRDPDFCPAIRLGGNLCTAQLASGMKAA